jgi:hypothetical protein
MSAAINRMHSVRITHSLTHSTHLLEASSRARVDEHVVAELRDTETVIEVVIRNLTESKKETEREIGRHERYVATDKHEQSLASSP